MSKEVKALRKESVQQKEQNNKLVKSLLSVRHFMQNVMDKQEDDDENAAMRLAETIKANKNKHVKKIKMMNLETNEQAENKNSQDDTQANELESLICEGNDQNNISDV